MGLYDDVKVPCPKCGGIYFAQSKGSQQRCLRTFSLNDCPDDVLSDVNRHAPFACEKCGTTFRVEMMPVAVPA